jgi:hypothetical protein
MRGGKAMHKMNRRKFIKTTGKIALTGATALGIYPLLSGFVRDPLKMAFASDSLGGFNVYNGINSNAKDIVAETFKGCLSKGLSPGICYKTSKPMVAVADGTVIEIRKMDDLNNYYKTLFGKEKNDAIGYLVKVVHGNIMSFYVHLKAPKAKMNQKVKRGEIIGYPDERWNTPRLLLWIDDSTDPNNYGINHGFMTYWDGATDLEIGKVEQNKRLEFQQQILNKLGEMVEGPEKYDLYRKKHKGATICKWSRIEKIRYVEYLVQNKSETFTSLTKEQFSVMKKEFYSNQPIVLTLPFKKG